MKNITLKLIILGLVISTHAKTVKYYSPARLQYTPMKASGGFDDNGNFYAMGS